jgi:uncharacterized protein YacL
MKPLIQNAGVVLGVALAAALLVHVQVQDVSQRTAAAIGIAAATVAGLLALALKAREQPAATMPTALQLKQALTALVGALLARVLLLGVAVLMGLKLKGDVTWVILSFFVIYLFQLPLEMRYALARGKNQV